MKRLPTLLIALTISSMVMAKEYHVSKTGDDDDQGTYEMPFLTIPSQA